MALLTRLFVFTAFLLFCFQSCMLNVHTTKGNGNIVNKELKISDYKEIYLSSSADVVYEHRSWKEPYLQVCVDENILPLMDIRVENGRLIIEAKGNENIQPTKFRVYTNSKTIENIRLDGSGDIHLKGEVNPKYMKIGISGSGKVDADSLYCESLDMDISGSGGVNLEGVSNNVKFNISGSGNIHAYNFQALNLDCDISGSGNIEAYANKSIHASISGAGNINYKGEPEQVEKNVSGSGNISKKE